MKLAFSSHLLFMLLDFGTLLLFTYHFTSIIFYTLSLKLSLLAVNSSFLKLKQYVDNGCLMARKICWKKVLLSWSSQRPLKKKKKKVNGVVCQTWRLALHKWFGRIFFFFFERERERVLTWHLPLIIALYHQTKIPIDFWCKQGLNGLGRS